MTQARIKRGSSFKAMFIFDEDEWAALQPLSAISAKFKQGSRETVLAAVSSPTARTITVTATPDGTGVTGGVPSAQNEPFARALLASHLRWGLVEAAGDEEHA